MYIDAKVTAFSFGLRQTFLFTIQDQPFLQQKEMEKKMSVENRECRNKVK